MDKLLLRTQLAFDNCKKHLDETETWGTEIESYLTQHVLIILCADIQQELLNVVEKRTEIVNDGMLKNYVLSTCKRVLRSVGKNEIAGFVGYFGSEAKEYLNKNISDKDVTIYNNAIDCRHDIAHKSGTNITFRELSDSINIARSFIVIVTEAISLNLEAAQPK